MTVVTVSDPCTQSRIHVGKPRTKIRIIAVHWPCIGRGDAGGDGVDIGGVGAGPAKAGPDPEMRRDSSTASGSNLSRSLTPADPEEGLGM